MNKWIELARHQRLETARLRLRKITMEDAAAIYDFSHDPEVARYMSWRPHESLGETRAIIAERYIPRALSMWAIVEKSSGTLVGTLNAGLDKPGLAELGWALNRKVWGRGYMTEAATAVVAVFFDVLGLSVVQSSCLAGNQRSARVMAKLGMTRLGERYDSFEKWEAPRLLEVWAVTRADYEKMKGRG